MTTANNQAENASKSQKDANLDNDDLDWTFDSYEEDKEKRITFQRVIGPIRSAILIHLLKDGLPREQWHQRGMFYFLMIQFHEDLDRPLYVYSALPALAMWYFPRISPMLVYLATRVVDVYRRSKYKYAKEILIPVASFSVASTLCAVLIDFRDSSTALELLYGPVSKWPAALLPIFPGMFLRLVNERPNSINGFVPEGKQGILLAVFFQAWAAVLPQFLQWPIWCAYSSPSLEYPSMFVEWVLCTLAWTHTQTSPLASYAIWLLVNQYRHANAWFRNSGGGPSVILQRERRGTTWYIVTITLTRLFVTEAGQTIAENEILTLHPQVWIPLVLIIVIGIYLLKYGLLLRIYKYQHKPLSKGKTIRLLRLRAQPCLPNAPIQCDMIHTDLRCPPQYVAVSHRWDSLGAPQELILIDGGLFHVSRSVHAFLLAKRTNLHPRYFWIDSICINQEDKNEKSRQVAIIRHIFEEAEMTLGWLGDEPGAKKAFELIQRISQTTTASAFSSILSSSDVGWEELKKLMSNEFWNRIWIIQEVAVAKARILRYGDQEIDWNDFSQALARIMRFGSSTEQNLTVLLERPEVLNALVMHEVKCHLADVTLIRLKDTLKLALRFKATLPIDKVYALLGLVDERHTPLLHPKFGAAADHVGRQTPAMSANMLAKDASDVLQLLSDILGTARGASNSRRGRAILDSGVDNALRYTMLLTRDLQRITERLGLLKDGQSDVVEEDPIQPDYSAKTSAVLIYIHVARDLVKHNDVLSFICHAGLGRPRNQELANLPSWVSDWSTDISNYILPWYKSVGVSLSTEVKAESVKSPQQASVFQDGGSKFLFVKALNLGRVAHSAKLAEDYVISGGDNATRSPDRDEVERDFLLYSSRFQTAYKLAKTHARSPIYQADADALEEAFHRTLAAESLAACKNFPATSARDWIAGPESTNPITAALWPEKHQAYWRNRVAISDEGGPDPCSHHERTKSDIFTQYLSTRRMTSSPNAKFAHLVHADIVPSLSQYRGPSCKSKPANGESRASIFDDGSSPSDGLLSGYAKYVDYTIGRALIVTDSGLMGLAESDSKDGDIVVQLQSRGRIVWLTLREEEYPKSAATEVKSASSEVKLPPQMKNASGQPLCTRSYRLIGEAYIDGAIAEAHREEDLQWFKLW